MRLIVNRGLDGKFARITESLEEFGQVYANKMAQSLISYSPVDTGAYMDGFYAGSGYSSAVTSSHGRPKNQPWQPYASDAEQRMRSGIAALRGSTTMTFGNMAYHAYQVEYDHGYRPFGKAGEMHSTHARDAWDEVRPK
jgi:hypothetical protein